MDGSVIEIVSTPTAAGTQRPCFALRATNARY